MWYQVTGDRANIRKAVKDLSKDIRVVRNTEESIYVETSTQEESWLNKVARDFGLSVYRAEEPTYEEARCGVLHTNVRVHSMRCNSCRRLKDNRIRSIQQSAIPVGAGISIPPVGDGGDEHEFAPFSPEGQDLGTVAEEMRRQVEDAMNLASELDQALKAIEGYQDYVHKLQEAKRLRSRTMESLRSFLGEEVQSNE